MKLDQVIERWCQENPLRAVGPDRLELRTDGGTVEIRAEGTGSDVLTLSSQWRAPEWLRDQHSPSMPSLEQIAESTAAARSGLLRCAVTDEGISVSMVVYLEGISRQAFMVAATEVGRAWQSLNTLTADLEASRETLAQAEEVLAELERAESEMRDQLAAAEEAAAERAATAAVEPEPHPGAVEVTAAETQAAGGGGEMSESCASCGATLPAEAQFCVSCGSPRPSQELPGGGPACSTCGAELKPGVRFCSTCGAATG